MLLLYKNLCDNQSNLKTVPVLRLMSSDHRVDVTIVLLFNITNLTLQTKEEHKHLWIFFQALFDYQDII